ncbi:MAG: hypothetical protein JNL28_06840 [Planctomycetes bacterium]|nr:hypothetical protein [Planctomycetota bacterium]
MSTVDPLARFRSDPLRRLVLLHLVLALAFVLWRVFETSPATASTLGSTWPTTLIGRGLTMVCITAAFAASVAILVFTYHSRREWPALLLLAALFSALLRRNVVDVFDIVYLLLVALAAAAAFATRRR